MSTKPQSEKRSGEQTSTPASARVCFQPLGSFVSSASREQLLGALKRLKPQLNARLLELERSPYACHYQLEIDSRDLREQHEIDVWLGIKGALTAAFPVNKRGAVRRLEP